MGDHKCWTCCRHSWYSDILLEFDRICKENISIPVVLSTLLGAVRHRVLPRDDDIDVVMVQEYDRLKEICRLISKEGYFLRRYDSDRSFDSFTAEKRQHGYHNTPREPRHTMGYSLMFSLWTILCWGVLEAVRCRSCLRF